MNAPVPEQSAVEAFRVPLWMHLAGSLVARFPGLWRRLGDLETRLLRDLLGDTEVRAPVYVGGLARAGTTITLELLARQTDMVSHRYRDYPGLFTPYAWNRYLDRVPRSAERPAERAHADGTAVTSESPEAFEEILWMAFFPDAHQTGHSAVLGRDTNYPTFESFYRDHLRKLLAVRSGRRYLAKGNYNLTRLGYLHRLFPDARFVLNVREPSWHIASLMKQHRLFIDAEQAHPRALTHMRRIGHFEFGLDRRPIEIGDPAAAALVRRLWREGREIEGWAHYWRYLHEHLLDALTADPALRAACRVVRFEDLCATPETTLARLFEHLDVAVPSLDVHRAAAGLHYPDYYHPPFSASEQAMIAAITADTAARLGYARGSAAPT